MRDHTVFGKFVHTEYEGGDANLTTGNRIALAGVIVSAIGVGVAFYFGGDNGPILPPRSRTPAVIRVTSAGWFSSCPDRPNVLGWLAAQCNGRQDCRIVNGRPVDHDICENTPKSLEVKWQCVRDESVTASREGSFPETGNNQVTLAIDCR